MKGFIEVHRAFSQPPLLLNVENIAKVEEFDADNGITAISFRNDESDVLVTEKYPTIRAMIADASN